MDPRAERTLAANWAAAIEQQSEAVCGWLARACTAAGDPGFCADLDALLDGVVERAACSVRAESAVLAVRSGGAARWRVYSYGEGWDRDALESGRLAPWELASQIASIVSVPVSSPRAHGYLTVRFPVGTGVPPEACRRLGVHAMHVAGTLEVAVALQESERVGERARSLSDCLEQRTRLFEGAVSRYEKLVMSFPGIVYVMGLGDNGAAPTPIYVSPQIESLIGISVQDWESDPDAMMRIVHPEDRGIIAANLLAFGKGEPACPFRMVTRDGGSVWMQPQAINYEENGHRYRQGILLDITQAKDAEAARERLEIELRLAQKLEAVGELAAGIAHEINTPIQFVGDTLRFLDGATADLMQLLAAYADLRDAVEAGRPHAEELQRVGAAEQDIDVDYVQERLPVAFLRAMGGIDRVATIVRAMRRFAHASSGAMAPTDINEGLRSTLVVATNVYKYVAEVDLQLQELPQVVCDAGEINQVFLNLIVNAAQAIEDVVGETGERGTIAVQTESAGDDVVISVRDSGCGIPPEVAARVFDPFFTTKEVGRGSGQGLALAHAIVVDRHHGRITFRSEEHGGTTFVVRLPIEAAA
ncbi:MAG: ATP-binding protein [Solirubrobacteraceae bacterium]